MSLSPESLLLLQPEASVFTRPTFCQMRTLVYGTRLSSGRRTVAAALRAMGRGEERHFTTYHRVLNRAVWSPFHLSRILLGLLVMAFLAPDAPLILLIDGTLERRWGRRIASKGRLHDAVRSQSGHVVTVLRHPLGVSDAAGACALVSTTLGITSLKRSHPDSSDQRQTWQPASHDVTGCSDPDLALETLGSRARDRVGSRRRFCRDQPGSYVPPLALDCTTLRSCPTATIISKPGVKLKKGPRQPKGQLRLKDTATAWLRQEIAWYAGQQLKMDLITGVALRHHDGEDPLPIRLSSSCAIPVASAPRLPFSVPTRPFPCSKSWPGTLAAGIMRSPLKKSAPISAWKSSGSGVRLPSLGPLPARLGIV